LCIIYTYCQNLLTFSINQTVYKILPLGLITDRDGFRGGGIGHAHLQFQKKKKKKKNLDKK
jgi:hypothetical protein